MNSGILTLNIKDKAALYTSYMPFVKNGGIFIPTPKQYKLGDEVFMLLTLPGSTDKVPVSGKVIWINPPKLPPPRTPGIGVQFALQDNGSTRNKIETLLAGSLTSDRPTSTM